MKCMTVIAIYCTRRSIDGSGRRELRFPNRLGDYCRHTGRSICRKFGWKNKLGLPNRARLEDQLVLTKSAKSGTKKKKLGLQK